MKKKRDMGTVSGALIFLHIPKAAGSTFSAVLRRTYKGRNIREIDGRDAIRSIREFRALPEAERLNVDVLMGHMTFGLHEYLRPGSKYITMLREPCERIISNYYYVLENPSHYLHQYIKSREMGLKEYALSGLSPVVNFQTRAIGGRLSLEDECDAELLSKAKDNLRRFFATIGLSERFDESLILMKKKLGWGIPYYLRQNITRSKPSVKGEVSDEIRAHINHANEMDLELYKYASELVENEISRHPDMAFELKRLRIINRMLEVIRILYRRRSRSGH